LWSYTKCNSDLDYCQPFLKGDIIYKQFFNPRDFYTFKFFHLINSNTDEDIPLEGIVTFEIGYDENETEFTNVIIDTTNIDAECFYFYARTFKVNSKDVDKFKEYEECVDELVLGGVNPTLASEICATNIYSDFMEVFYSEPYCLVKCVDTILLEGYYPQHDCNGNFYGTFASGSATNSYKLQLRIKAEVNPTQHTIEVVKFNKKRKSTNILKTFILRSKLLPYYVVERLSIIFAAKEFTVDGAYYEEGVEIQKNLDEGKMWAIETVLTQECGETNFTCDN
jgi:hypothetical protein